MATAVRVTGSHRPEPHDIASVSHGAVWSGVGVVGVGEFGRAVQRLLVTAGAHALSPRELTEQAQRGDTGLVAAVVALWRPLPELCEQVDTAAATSGLPWLPVVAEHPHLVVGPWIQPGTAPCHRCYRHRRAQHDTQPAATAALTAAYQADDTLGPGGHLPHHVRQAVGLAMVARTAADPGLVHSLHLLTGHMSSHRVVACHGCPRCGAEKPLGTGGAIADLVHRLVTTVPRDAVAVTDGTPA